MNIDWTLFDFIFAQQDEKFDEVTIRNDMDNFTQFSNLRRLIEGSHQHTKFGVGFKLPNLWERVSRHGLVKSSVFFSHNNDGSENLHLNVKALKWDSDFLCYLGSMNHLAYRHFGLSVFGGAFYKVNPGLIIGMNSKVKGLVGSPGVEICLNPSLIINSLDYSAEISAEALLTETKLKAIYVKKPELSGGLMPYLSCMASVSWPTKEITAGAGVALTKFWHFSRFGLHAERNFKTKEDKFGLFADEGRLVSRLFVRHRHSEPVDVGMDIEAKDLRSYVSNLGRANLQFGVTANKWNNGFLTIGFDFN